MQACAGAAKSAHAMVATPSSTAQRRLVGVPDPLPIGGAQFSERHPHAVAVLLFEHHDITVQCDERRLDGLHKVLLVRSFPSGSLSDTSMCRKPPTSSRCNRFEFGDLGSIGVPVFPLRSATTVPPKNVEMSSSSQSAHTIGTSDSGWGGADSARLEDPSSRRHRQRDRRRLSALTIVPTAPSPARPLRHARRRQRSGGRRRLSCAFVRVHHGADVEARTEAVLDPVCRRPRRHLSPRLRSGRPRGLALRRGGRSRQHRRP